MWSKLSRLQSLADAIAAEGEFGALDQIKDGCPQSCGACREPVPFYLILDVLMS